MTDQTITVMQVFAALGIRPEPEQSWSVGSRVAAIYRSTHGIEPPKENRPKTSGGGTHCFAVYPMDWFKRIAEVVQTVAQDQASQGNLFGGQ